MPQKRCRPEEIIAKLREAEVLLGEGKKVPEVVRTLGVHEVTYYRWRKEYGGLKVSQAKRLKDLERENARLRSEDALTAALIGLARSFGRYGHKRITGLLQMAGWSVNAKRVQRIWRREGLKVPSRQPKSCRLWLADGSCIRLRPEHKNHVWAYDFVSETTHDGRKLRLLTAVDEYTRECLAISVARRMTANDVLWVLADLFLEYGVPEHIRSATTAPSSSPKQYASGSPTLGSPLSSSNRATLGRTATSSPSTAS
jgi:transposase